MREVNFRGNLDSPHSLNSESLHVSPLSDIPNTNFMWLAFHSSAKCALEIKVKIVYYSHPTTQTLMQGQMT